VILRKTAAGYIVALPGDDPDAIASACCETGYPEEFCLAPSFDPTFVLSLAEAGFLVMSAMSGLPNSYLLLPKLHHHRALLTPSAVHASRTVRRLAGRYELRADDDLSVILGRCVETHGEDWLTPPLRRSFRFLWNGDADQGYGGVCHPTSFGLYREGRLVAGEFGFATGSVYTSYSGFSDENSAGTVQMVLTGRYLEEGGYRLWDLGMPMDYKAALGAQDVDRGEFLRLFRAARTFSPLREVHL